MDSPYSGLCISHFSPFSSYVFIQQREQKSRDNVTVKTHMKWLMAEVGLEPSSVLRSMFRKEEAISTREENPNNTTEAGVRQ